jgi:hypothetical protein
MMKHLLGGVALAALLTAGLPAMAQTDSSSGKQPPAASPSAGTAPQSGTTTAGNMERVGSGAKHKASPTDNMAEQLNKKELQRVENGGGQPMSGTSQPPAAAGTTSAGGNQGSGTSGAH